MIELKNFKPRNFKLNFKLKENKDTEINRALLFTGFLLDLIFYVLVFFNSNITYIIAWKITKKDYLGTIFKYFCFGVFNWKEIDTICFELGIPKKKPKNYMETFSVSFQNKY